MEIVCAPETYRRFESSSLRQTKRTPKHGCSFCLVWGTGIEEDSRVGAVLREQNALPCGSWITVSPTAKDDVDNVGAGRAAKGANPIGYTKKPLRLGWFLGL